MLYLATNISYLYIRIWADNYLELSDYPDWAAEAAERFNQTVLA